MKAMDHSALQLLSNSITEKISTSSIYCFGKKKQSHKVQNPFQDPSASHKENTHFYLLVFTNETIPNAVADISDTIKTETEGRYTVTLLLHKATAVRHLTPHKKYFFHEAMTRGYKVYEHPIVPPNIGFEEKPQRNTRLVRSYWDNRSQIAATYLETENQLEGFNTERIQQAMLHTAVEQTCLGIIEVFLGYSPNHFALEYLFELCELCCSLTSEIFPNATEEDRKLLSLLKAHPSKLRWANLKPSGFIDTEILERRSHLFYEKATLLIASELERLENHEPKNENHGIR